MINEKTPANSTVWQYLFWWNLVAQDFDAANEIAEKTTAVRPEDLRLAERFAPLLNENGYLETDNLIDFLRRSQKRDFFNSRMLVYDKSNPRTQEERVRIVGAWLDMRNGAKGNLELRYDSDTRRLRLMGPVKKIAQRVELSGPYTVDLNYLQILDPLALDIRGTKIKSLNQLAGINPVEVDIRNTPISNLAPLSKFRTLQRIVVGKDQFSPSQLQNVPLWIEVVIQNQDSAPGQRTR